MQHQQLIPNLFRSEYRKIVSVLCKLLGIENIKIAEDITSDTFLSAAELWSVKGPPENPTAWLYLVAKNKTRDYLRRDVLFTQTIFKEIKQSAPAAEEMDIDLSVQNINDSQLAMMFVVCHPCNPPKVQIALALDLLCGFGVDEIANAFLTNKPAIYKQLLRAKEKLKAEKIKIVPPTSAELTGRLPSVLMTLYLLYNEGYYSSDQNITLRKDLCLEAMRLTHLLVSNEKTNQPSTNALLSLMCFHSSRFDARLNDHGQIILYHEQDTSLWNQELISRGEHFLTVASKGNEISKYHLEAGIAYWHTIQSDVDVKWKSILLLYDQLLSIEYSPIAALNRTYAVAKVHGKSKAIPEAEKIDLKDHFLYHSLLGELYSDVNNGQAISHFQLALTLTKSTTDQLFISNKMQECQKQTDSGH